MKKRTRARTVKSNTVIAYVEHGYVSFAEGPADVVVCDFDIAQCDHQPGDIKVQGRRCRLALHKAKALTRTGKRVVRIARQNSIGPVDGYLV